MITTANIRPQGFKSVLSEGLPKAADNLLSIQKNILNRQYKENTGNLNSLLSSRPYIINVSDESASIRVQYIAEIRFKDMKRLPNGKFKKRRIPIYNKYVWGFLMGYTYNLLRQGMSSEAQKTFFSVKPIEIKI